MDAKGGEKSSPFAVFGILPKLHGGSGFSTQNGASTSDDYAAIALVSLPQCLKNRVH